MNLAGALRISGSKLTSAGGLESNVRAGALDAIAFVGAGGKTTALFQLARELQSTSAAPILVTATTHFGSWQLKLADTHIITESFNDFEMRDIQGVTLVTGPVGPDNRTGAAGPEILARLLAAAKRLGTPLLIEADGARQKLLKAPELHEPAIPDCSGLVIVVASLAALGKPLTAELVHRPEVFSKLSGLEIGKAVSIEAIARVLTHPAGGLKNIPRGARRVVLLTQADRPELESTAGRIASALLEQFEALTVSSSNFSTIQTFEKTAAIILAAGGATRFGSAKQLLEWRGQPFVRAVAKTALNAQIGPVIVVTGAFSDEVEAAVRDLPVQIVPNADWRSGQSTSVRAGLLAAPVRAGSAIFLLADQPQIGTEVIRALAAHHATELFPIVAPQVRSGQRANPVLFDRTTFPSLLSLKGDVGGRAIFSDFPVEYLPWHDESLLLDVDRPSDYPHLKELE